MASLYAASDKLKASIVCGGHVSTALGPVAKKRVQRLRVGARLGLLSG
jgi:hypothetical protein